MKGRPRGFNGRLFPREEAYECDGYERVCTKSPTRWVRVGPDRIPLCDECADRWRDDNFDEDGRLK